MRLRHLQTLIALALTAAFAGGLACDPEEEGDDGDELKSVDCAAVEVPRFEEMTLWNSCVGCHSTQLSGASRANAPADFNYDTHEAALFDPFETAEVVVEGEMPPGAPPSDADKELITIWAKCGAP